MSLHRYYIYRCDKYRCYIYRDNCTDDYIYRYYIVIAQIS